MLLAVFLKKQMFSFVFKQKSLCFYQSCVFGSRAGTFSMELWCIKCMKKTKTLKKRNKNYNVPIVQKPRAVLNVFTTSCSCLLIFPCLSMCFISPTHRWTAVLLRYLTWALVHASTSPESCALLWIFWLLEHLLKVLFPTAVWDDTGLLLISLAAGHGVRTWLMRKIPGKISANVWLHFRSQLLPVASAHRHYRRYCMEPANLSNC